MEMLPLIKFGFWLVRTLPAPLLRPLPYLFGLMSYFLAPEKRRIIIANQRQVLGTTSALRLHWQALRVMVNLIHSYHLLVRLSLMSDDEVRQAVIYRGGKELAKALEARRGAIILGAHIAGFNVLAPFTALHAQPAGAFVEPVQPPELFDFVSQIRARTGMELLLPDREGAAGALRLLRNNGVLLVAADRYLGTNGTKVPLFGRPAYLSHGPLVLAQRNGTPLLPATLRRRRDGRFEVQLHPPLALANTGNRRADLETNLRQIAGTIERTVSGAAEQWLILEPVWESEEAIEAAAPTLPGRAGTTLALGGWLLFGALLLVIARAWRRNQDQP